MITRTHHGPGHRRRVGVWLKWTLGITAWLAAAWATGRSLGMPAFYAVHAAGVAGFGTWLAWRAAVRRPVADGHPTFGALGALVALAHATESAMRAVGVVSPRWWVVLKAGVVLGLLAAGVLWQRRAWRDASAGQ